MKKILLLLPLLSILFSCARIKYSVEAPQTAQTAKPVKTEDGIVQRDGKCVKNCITPDRYESVWTRLPIYTGNDEEAPLKIETLLLEPAQNKWMKKPDGEIYLVQSPAVTKDVWVLADTIFYKDFRYDRFERKQLAEKGGAMREMEVICSTERTPNLFLQISAALKSYGYMQEAKNRWDMKFSEAIQKFQKDNSLPVGDLNLETMQFLGI